jgi:phospholipase/lecithinase/hemolysin
MLTITNVANGVELQLDDPVVLNSEQQTTLQNQALGGAQAYIPPLLNFTLTPEENFSEIVAFGDSLFDTENLGRSADGPVVPEYLAEALDVPLTNLAFWGATTGIDRTDVLLPGGSVLPLVPSVLTQVTDYLSGLSGAAASPDALYTIWAGANDYTSGLVTDPSLAVANLVNAVTNLRDAGAENFLLFNLGDLGRLPAIAADPNTSAALSALTVIHNQQLAAAIPAIPDVTATLVDVDTQFAETLAALGAEDFWMADGVHLKTAVHKITADLALTTLGVNGGAVPSFSDAIQRVEIAITPRADDQTDYNAFVKQDQDGNFSLFNYDPATGLGAVFHRNDAGRVNGATLFLQDGQPGDLTGVRNGSITDPITAVAIEPSAESPLFITLKGAGQFIHLFDMLLAFDISGSTSGTQVLEAVFADGTIQPLLSTLGDAAGLPRGIEVALANRKAFLGSAEISDHRNVEFRLRDLSSNTATLLTIDKVTGNGFRLVGDGITIEATKVRGGGSFKRFTQFLQANGDVLEAISLNELGSINTGQARTIQLQATLYREAAFNNQMGFYLADRSGNVVDSLTGQILSRVTDSRTAYLQAVKANALVTAEVGDGETGSFNGTFVVGGSIDLSAHVLLPFLVSNASLDAVAADFSNLYVAVRGINGSGADQMQLLGNNLIGFEDIAGGGDNDFDDVVFQVDGLQAV